jgi:hypothetical protein
MLKRWLSEGEALVGILAEIVVRKAEEEAELVR